MRMRVDTTFELPTIVGLEVKRAAKTFAVFPRIATQITGLEMTKSSNNFYAELALFCQQSEDDHRES